MSNVTQFPANDTNAARFRSNPLSDMVAAMSDEERKGAIAVLDALSRPFTVREIEVHMRRAGLSRAQSEKAARYLRQWHIIAMIGGEA